MITLLLAIHSHQPVGNFDWVFEKSMDRCYLPLLELLAEHPRVKMSLHYSGPLWEWMEDHRPTVIDTVSRLVRQGQVELMAGGFYEPLLASIPERDAVGQVNMMRDYLKSRFQCSATGLWLTERIWEPSLPKLLAATGIRYTVLDDTHFYYAGLDHRDMRGYYLTEREGQVLAVFPTLKKLRYFMPFRSVEENLDFFRHLGQEWGDAAVTYGDDGEKFGLWPKTYDWVIKKGWLKKFMRTLEENADWLTTQTLGDYLDQAPPQGRVYLPTASYEEMTEWALPAAASARFSDIIADLKAKGKYDEYRPFLRGGTWDNFLVKYSESNILHKRSVFLSDRVEENPEARRRLWRGQCNCAYWHGLFGGLYLPHLRDGVCRELIEAETILYESSPELPEVRVDVTDFDRDGHDEVLIGNRWLSTCFSPWSGGSLVELDLRPLAYNLTNTLTRREEAYHRPLREAGDNAVVYQGEEEDREEETEIRSIHDLVMVKEKGLENYLIYDYYQRHSFMDHFLAPGTGVEEFLRDPGVEVGDFIGAPYDFHLDHPAGEDRVSLVMTRMGRVLSWGREKPVQVTKELIFDSSLSLSAGYRFKNPGPEGVSFWYGVEFNLGMLSDIDPERYLLLPEPPEERILLTETGERKDINRLSLVNTSDGFAINFVFDRPVTAWFGPIYTVSQSESGFEKNYQGTMLTFVIREALEKNEEARLGISLTLTVMDKNRGRP
ncbi:MAG: DUF1926 domain-containing protein [Deltaproteobacteria bacterium]|nr:DUF1926 domain-containing protein [Deltaproteobacteria bacterium]